MKMIKAYDGQQKFEGLGAMIAIITVLLSSPVLYFTVQLLLGHADLFAINGYK
ncbi:hypothetical protein N6H14_06220 [Paenibacillus sp. CC-CFT747]|nr:hypothetical protein N6H14_06220 [Paenibacillus sp. CC-CFT747]